MVRHGLFYQDTGVMCAAPPRVARARVAPRVVLRCATPRSTFHVASRRVAWRRAASHHVAPRCITSHHMARL